MVNEPYLISLSGSKSQSGMLSFIDGNKNLPFAIKRVYWVYDTHTELPRGNHAHANTEKIIVCLYGNADVAIEDRNGTTYNFILNDPAKALFLPAAHWIKIACSQHAILVVLCSTNYEDDVIITDYKLFKEGVK